MTWKIKTKATLLTGLLWLLTSTSSPLSADWIDTGSDLYTIGEEVGIGIADPSSALDINGNIPVVIRKSPYNPRGTYDGDEYFRMSANTSDYIISLQDSTGRIQHYWNATPSPNTYLVSNEPALKLAMHVTGDVFAFFRGAGGTAGDTVSWSKLFTIQDSGNVGVGVDSPANKFEVKGKIRAEEVVVESNWADFVFEENYELMPLEEVADFISEEKRLPGVPTAEDVQTQGASVGETQAMLLQKVEELTLYLIQQEAENAKLMKRIETLETLINSTP